MNGVSVLSDEFAEAAAEAGRLAREEALQDGYPVVFLDTAERYIEEFPDGRRFEVRLDASHPRESHCTRIRELTSNAA